MRKVISLVAGAVVALALAGCAQHAQPMPSHAASQAGHSSKLGKFGS